MLQVPKVTPVTMLPLIPEVVQTAGVALLKITARPELAVALAVVVPPTANVAGKKVKLPVPMVWSALPTVMLVVTCVAAL